MHITGQARIQTFLQQLVQRRRVPHALLIQGPTGGGSLALALWLTQALQCEKNQTDEQGPGLFGDEPVSTPTLPPCGQCNACRKTGQMIHADVHYAYPTIGANALSTDFIKEWREIILQHPYIDINTWLQRIGAENKQGNINKDECNAIIKKLSLKAFEGRQKILLMWLPEYLGKEGNRLLKLIEEPPEDTQFILVAENTDAILPTILSRCQVVKTDPLTDENVIEGLSALRQIDPDRARQIAFLADGDLNTALNLAANETNDDAALLLDWLRKCWRGHGPDLLRWTEEFAKMGRENQKQFLMYGLHFLRELLIYTAASGHVPLRLPPQERATAENMAKVLTPAKIERIVGMFNDNIYYIERNANAKALFLSASIKMHEAMKA